MQKMNCLVSMKCWSINSINALQSFSRTSLQLSKLSSREVADYFNGKRMKTEIDE